MNLLIECYRNEVEEQVEEIIKNDTCDIKGLTSFTIRNRGNSNYNDNY